MFMQYALAFGALFTFLVIGTKAKRETLFWLCITGILALVIFVVLLIQGSL